MQVNDTNSALPAWASQQTGASDIENRATLLKDDFLQLLVAQLQNQDPLNPASNQEFAAQLAQFSSLEQLTQMNETMQTGIESDNALNRTLNNGMAAEFIGKEVHAAGNQVALQQGEPVTLRFFQERASEDTVIDIYNAQGSKVRTLELGANPAGGLVTEWDGKDFEGNNLNSGLYSYEVSATDPEGGRVATTTFMIGEVTGVRYVDNRAALLMGERTVPLENVIEIVEPGSDSSAPEEQ